MSTVVDDGSHHHDNCPHQSPLPSHPSHLLEVTIISAQDLYPATCSVKTYASAWVDSEHKLKTRVDTVGRTNPSWNDKLIFRVDEKFLHSDTSSVTIDVYAVANLRKHPIVGTARVILSSLNPTSSTCCVALQVRRPMSLRPQGIVNIGVAILDDYINSMPLDRAFILRDMAASPNRGILRTPSIPRTPSSLASTSYRSRLDENEEWSQENTRGKQWKLQRNNSVDVNAEAGRGVVEQESELLQSKLEKWRVELTPLHEMSQKKHRRSMTLPHCFCGGSAKD